MSLINKFFSISKNLEDKLSSFKSLKKTKAILQLFSAIENYSENSEIRYVGGCVRKALNNEVLDDIDLAVNLKPNECIEALNKKIILNFMKLELNMELLQQLLVIINLKLLL